MRAVLAWASLSLTPHTSPPEDRPPLLGQNLIPSSPSQRFQSPKAFPPRPHPAPRPGDPANAGASVLLSSKPPPASSLGTKVKVMTSYEGHLATGFLVTALPIVLTSQSLTPLHWLVQSCPSQLGCPNNTPQLGGLNSTHPFLTALVSAWWAWRASQPWLVGSHLLPVSSHGGVCAGPILP